MDDLILKCLRGEASPFERMQLERWRDAAPENALRAKQVAALWELANQAVPPGNPPPAAATILAIGSGRATRPHTGLARRAGVWQAVAAVSLLGIAGAAGWAWLTSSRSGFAPRQFAAGPTTSVTLGLEDGTTIRLAPSSRIAFSGGRTDRRVELTGTAFFAVARDARRPFIVQAGSSQVRVTGTRFELRLEGSTLRLVLVEGKVKLSASDRDVAVEAGQVAYVRGGSISVVTVEDAYRLLDWPGGLLIFQDTPLAQAAHEVSQRFGRPVSLVPELRAGPTVSAWFEGETFDQVVGTICLVTSTSCTITDSLTTIAP